MDEVAAQFNSEETPAMPKTYYTYHIRLTNYERVQIEKRDSQHQSLGEPSGALRYQEKLSELTPLLQLVKDGAINDSSQIRFLGEILFDVLFDDGLRPDFVSFYHQVVQQEKQLLRVELDIDEQGMPELASLPWEFLSLPARANLGTIWVGTVPDLVFSRRRSQWIPAQSIQLEQNEKLRIALVVSAPPGLRSVEYKAVQETLERLVSEQANQVELLPIVESANPEAIDTVLSKEPHIFHFIGHGRLENESNQEIGQIALVDPDFGDAMWVDADYFSELFNQHRPGVVILQTCEGGMLSSSEAFIGIASRVVQQNVPVVVAMQYEVTNSTASRFALRFYQQLAVEDPVDIAVQCGRRAIALGPTRYYKRDFATPVIFMRVRDGHVFQKSTDKSSRLTAFLDPRNTSKTDKDSLFSDTNCALEVREPFQKQSSSSKDELLHLCQAKHTFNYQLTPIYLHFLDRELLSAFANSNKIQYHPQTLEVFFVLVLATSCPIYCALSFLWEIPGEDFNIKRVFELLIEYRYLNLLSKYPTPEEFLESRKEYYFFNKEHYPMYFESQSSYVSRDITPQLQIKTGNTTTTIERKLAEWKDSHILSKNDDGTLTIVDLGLKYRGERAITKALFQQEASKFEYKQNIITKINRKISQEFTLVYMNEFQGDIVTGLSFLSVFDGDLSRHFPQYDFPILRKIVSNTIGNSVFEPSVENFERILDLKGSVAQIEYSDTVFKFVQNMFHYISLDVNYSARRLRMISWIDQLIPTDRKINFKISSDIYLKGIEKILKGQEKLLGHY